MDARQKEVLEKAIVNIIVLIAFVSFVILWPLFPSRRDFWIAFFLMIDSVFIHSRGVLLIWCSLLLLCWVHSVFVQEFNNNIN